MREQIRLCTVCSMAKMAAWHFQNHIQGVMNDMNMLLSCFRWKMPAMDCIFIGGLSAIHFWTTVFCIVFVALAIYYRYRVVEP